MSAWTAVCSLGALAVLRGQVPVVVVLPEPIATRAVAAVAAACGADGRVGAAAFDLPATGSGATVLFGVDEWQAWRLARAGRLAPPPGRERAGPALPWSLGYSLVLAGSARPPSTNTWANTWEGLALAPALHDRLGLCPPAVDPTPWFACMEQVLSAGQPETAGYALWTTLDARAGRYADSWQDLLARLANGELLAAVLPTAALDPAASEPRRFQWLDLGPGTPRARIGLAVTAGAGEDAAWRLLRRLATDPLAASLGQELGFGGALPAAALPFDGARAERWLAYFDERIRGHGRGIEQVADTLDAVFAVGFVLLVGAVALVARRRQRGSDRLS